MLIATLNSVAALRYPRFEVLVIVNNTPEAALWRPVQAHCERLGARFKFVYLERVEGYKAGALTAALPWMAPEAEVIALIDADYTVHPDWLAALVPAFADAGVGMVQAPQDHRDGGGSAFRGAMNAEYAGFFDIGMVQRNEANAIITHGTMLLVRRRAFEATGGWSADTITEDTEFGLRLLRAGWRAAYTNRRYGWGVLPDTFRAFQTQRDRWAYGAVQIIRKHWRAMLPGERSLSAGQKFHFVSGWSHWLADAFGVLAALLNLLWVPMILFVGVLIPMLPFTVPILAMFAVNLLHCALLYRLRMRLPPVRIAGAALAAMSLQLTVAVAVAKGLCSGRQAFRRTEKGGLARLLALPGRARRAGMVEGAIGVALALSAVVLWVTNLYRYGQTELYVFALTLAVQGLPFLAAPAMAWLERVAPLPELAAPLGECPPPVGVGLA
jgi:cellulose synthase/poly-beta-1,6-N-acetylglucosamine synthase-like glycosyltransferase